LQTFSTAMSSVLLHCGIKITSGFLCLLQPHLEGASDDIPIVLHDSVY